MVNERDAVGSAIGSAFWATRCISRGTSGQPTAEAMWEQLLDQYYLGWLLLLCRLMGDMHQALYTSRNASVSECERFWLIGGLDHRLLEWTRRCGCSCRR